MTEPAASIWRTRLLRPRLTADVVHRPRLIEHLNRGLAHPLTLIATPPGFGKTTLLCDWAAQCSIPVAWLCVDDRGDDLRSFAVHFVAAIQAVAPEIGRETLGLLKLRDLPSPRLIAAALDNELIELTEEIALVLDDYHLVSNPNVHELVGAFLDLPPPGFHLMLATRADPPLPLTRLRVRGQLTELRADDLRFTLEETAAFFERSASLSLDAAAIARIETQAEGWVAGLRLATLSLRDGATPDAVLAASEGRRLLGLMDALTDEVLAAQPEEIRDFLLRTSVVERICAPLAVSLLDDGTSEETAAATLDQIAHANLFLSPLEDPSWYRYHALFRGTLRTRLTARTARHDLAALHARASAWLADRGLIDEAIGHAAASGDPEAPALVVERQIHPALDRDDVPALESWLRLLTPEALERRPALLLGRSWVAYLRGNWALHGRLLAEAITSLEANPGTLDASTVAGLEGEIELGQSMHLLEEGNSAGAGEAAQRALTLLPSTHRYAISLALSQLAYADFIEGRGDVAIHRLHAFLRSYDRPVDLMFVRILTSLMRLHAFAGNLEESQQVAVDLYQIASEHGFTSQMSWVNYQLGAIAYERNHLDAALEHFSAVVTDPYRAHTTPLRESAFGLALTRRALGFEVEARLTLDRLREFFQQTANVEQLALIRVLQGHFSPEVDEIGESSPKAPDRGSRHVSMGAMMANPVVLHVSSLLRLAAAENLAEAEVLLGDLLMTARASHFTAGEIELLALQTVLAQTRGQDEEAAALLEQALDLAARGGFVRTFLDRGPPLAAALGTLRPRSKHSAFIDRLLAAFAGKAPAVGRPAVPDSGSPIQAVDALTDREIEILEKLAARLSYREIADALIISPFTVKAHASNIYGKLGASGRRDAVAKARARGLIAES